MSSLSLEHTSSAQLMRQTFMRPMPAYQVQLIVIHIDCFSIELIEPRPSQQIGWNRTARPAATFVMLSIHVRIWIPTDRRRRGIGGPERVSMTKVRSDRRRFLWRKIIATQAELINYSKTNKTPPSRQSSLSRVIEPRPQPGALDEAGWNVVCKVATVYCSGTPLCWEEPIKCFVGNYPVLELFNEIIHLQTVW